VSRGDLPEFAADSFEDGSDSRSLLWPLICALPPRQRAVVVLRFYQDLTERQVAEELGCSIGTVKSQGHDAMQALRRGLGAWATGEVRA
jgi:RNA polymerase sigma factor (sigma-70 family)